jgi:hypothetical protein
LFAVAGYFFLDLLGSLIFGVPLYLELFLYALFLGLGLAYFMTFRGFLFSELYGTTRRSRLYRTTLANVNSTRCMDGYLELAKFLWCSCWDRSNQPMKITSIKGFADILPGEVETWQLVEAKARRVFDLYNFA